MPPRVCTYGRRYVDQPSVGFQSGVENAPRTSASSLASSRHLHGKLSPVGTDRTVGCMYVRGWAGQLGLCYVR